MQYVIEQRAVLRRDDDARFHRVMLRQSQHKRSHLDRLWTHTKHEHDLAF
jgi:hypothetical protein